MEQTQQGTVLSVRGSVVDAHFSGRLPEVRNVLATGDNGKLLIEVSTQLDNHTVRGVALTPTQGLGRGITPARGHFFASSTIDKH